MCYVSRFAARHAQNGSATAFYYRQKLMKCVLSKPTVASANRSRTRERVPEQTPPNATSPVFSLTPLDDNWEAQFGGGSTAHTSATNLSPAFGNDVSPIPHGLQDVSECGGELVKNESHRGTFHF